MWESEQIEVEGWALQRQLGRVVVMKSKRKVGEHVLDQRFGRGETKEGVGRDQVPRKRR